MGIEPTYLEKLEGYLIDEFHVGLMQVLEGIWSDVLHGDWYCHLEFFKSFQVQLEHVMRLQNKPLQLNIYLEHLNFSKKPGSQGGYAKDFARSWMPIYRQRIFLFNVLYLLLRERASNGQNLNLVLSGIRNALHLHILTVFSFLESEFETGKFTELRSLIEPCIETHNKAAVLVKEMSTSLQRYGFAIDEVDSWNKQRILFRKNALEARFNEAFKDWGTQRFFNTLHLEIERLLGLIYLENLSHASSQSASISMGDADSKTSTGIKTNMAAPIDIFFSYAHADEALMNQVRRHLVLYDRLGKIRKWHDREILPGNEWKGQIDERLRSAKIILLFVSTDFFESDYCYDIEMKEALLRHESGETTVIPIILRPCDWQLAPFSHIQALPTDGKAITTWENIDEACLNIAKGIMAVVSKLSKE
jgi:hypothetical protein